jgi:hypothetical protein
MKRLSFLFGSLTTVLLSVSLAAQAPPAAGQGGAPAAPPAKNLQVLPKDWTTAQVIPVMRGIAEGLGVECGHCHVWTAQGAPTNDFPADTKPTKLKARVMLRMVMNINSTIQTEFPKLGKPANELVQVQCVTCHRGVPIPKQLVDIVADTAKESSASAAITKYKDLRKEFYGKPAYDFSDQTLFDDATRAIADMKFDDAILYAQTNIDFNAMSARSYQVMAQAYQRKQDMPKAIAAMQKAVSLEPDNQQFKTQLNNMQNPPAGRGAGRGGAGRGGAGRGQ